MSLAKFLIVHYTTPGLHQDAMVLADALQRAAGGAEVYAHGMPFEWAPDYNRPIDVPTIVASRAPFDAVFLLERLFGHPPLRSAQLARRRVWIPNVEWFMPQDEAEILAHPPDIILYKNQFTKERCEQLAGFSAVAARIVSGWTTRDFCPAPPARLKDFRTFLHVRGFSDQKQADVLLDAWRSNPDFPLLKLITSPYREFALRDMRAAPNIQIIARYLSEAELRHYQHSCGVHVYPSNAEGFGHALNEARICGSVLVTTQAPPMSDLVTRSTGFLIPVVDTDITPYRRSLKYQVRPAAIAETIRTVLATPVAHLAEYARRGRESYVRDQHAFQAAIRQVLRHCAIQGQL